MVEDDLECRTRSPNFLKERRIYVPKYEDGE
jgi:hypothetical protein